MRLKQIAAFGAVVLSCAVVYGGASAQTAPAGDAQHGFTVFKTVGCYECHGFEAQGMGKHGNGTDTVGPALAPNPLPYSAFAWQVRRPRGIMPVYSTHILSDKDLADVYAYVSSRPAAKAPSSLPLLNAVRIDPAH
jgi:ubiquinol-cytochrome c reductase cytochrome c subunit